MKTFNEKSITEASYDEIPYQGVSYEKTHPARIATLASLFGIPFSPPENSRILELGCAEGSNLIPMAVDYPNSEFLGIDLSSAQIESGNRFLNNLNLQNIRLVKQDIMEFPESEGTFDYIILHGIYSWVPEPVRKKVLEICQNHLSENGLAFVSFNAFPGGHIRTMVGDMLKFHGRQETEGQKKVDQAREFYDILLETVPENTGMYSSCLWWEKQHVLDVPDQSVRHETLSDHNETFYFTDFMNQAKEYDLQYVGDLRFASMFPIQCSEENHARIVRTSQNRIEYEQYLDFLNFRVFRETVLRRKNGRDEIALDFDFKRMENYYYSTSLKASKSEGDPGPTEFKDSISGKEITTGNPVVQTILFEMAGCYPEDISFEQLRSAILERFPDSNQDELSGQLGQLLFEFYKKELIELSLRSVPCSREPGLSPSVSELAREQLVSGLSVTNLKHAPVQLNSFEKLLLPKLDGSHDRTSLLEFLKEEVHSGRIHLMSEDLPLPADSPEVASELETMLDQTLYSLAQRCLIKSETA